MHVHSIAIPVSEMERALAFYTSILPFHIISDSVVDGAKYARLMGVAGLQTRNVRLRLGREEIELVENIGAKGRPLPLDSKSNDHWFQHIALIVADMDRAFALLQKHKVTFASLAPQTLPDWNLAAGGIKAFYFKDFDGNHLELLQFPPGKGEPRWHEHSGALFLGIDHTAIVVHDTKAALKFYCEGLGLNIKGRSENHGIEQERLNNIAGAHLAITSVGGDTGPAIEFLEYLQPRTGRPIPTDTKANDLWHWKINLSVSPTSDPLKLTELSNAAMSSPELINMRDDNKLATSAYLRDPTGHAVMVSTKQSKRRAEDKNPRTSV